MDLEQELKKEKKCTKLFNLTMLNKDIKQLENLEKGNLDQKQF